MTNRAKDTDPVNTSTALKRRTFLTGLGVTAAAIGTPSLASAQPNSSAAGTSNSSCAPPEMPGDHLRQSYELRVAMATQNLLVGRAVNVGNGDFELYADKGGTYTKALPHDAYGRVDPAAFASLMTALDSGNPSDFEKIIMGARAP